MYIQELLVIIQTSSAGNTIAWSAFCKVVLPVLLSQIVLSAIFTYVNFIFLIPRFLKQGSILKYSLALLSCMLVFTPVYYGAEEHFYPLLGWHSYEKPLSFISSLVLVVSANFINIFLSIAVSYLLDWRTVHYEKELIEQEKVKTELAFLKSQINPHFLFNTINDIYVLTYQKSDEAPDALLKLSELLRYMLRDSEEQFVPLDKEITYIQHVVDLQKTGQKGRAYINMEIEGKIRDQKIAPLILINFIENAFKHGVFDQAEHPILIKLTADERYLNFRLWNLKNKNEKDKTGGIGLSNVKRRLSLLYPEKHLLTINDNAATFEVLLKLELV